MHNQADSLQITKKQDETERNKQKKKNSAHMKAIRATLPPFTLPNWFCWLKLQACD